MHPAAVKKVHFVREVFVIDCLGISEGRGDDGEDPPERLLGVRP
jgi:hypothetical protein